MERTFAIIKPDAVERNIIGKILARIEEDGFKIVAIKKISLSKGEAEGFYYVHAKRPFFNDLVAYMTSGPVVALVLEKENAIKSWRDAMGATNPTDAADGTIRKLFGTNIERNATHGSDSPETAKFEIGYFFNALEIHP